jgi:hypothetical protein
MDAEESHLSAPFFVNKSAGTLSFTAGEVQNLYLSNALPSIKVPVRRTVVTLRIVRKSTAIIILAAVRT